MTGDAESLTRDELLRDRLRRIPGVLRSGELVDDRAFDDAFPLVARRASSVHWTPVEVAVRAVKLLTERVRSPVVLDVGAGVGKFCLAAKAAADAEIRGIEHRKHFVDVARAAAAKIGVDVRFDHGRFEEADLRGVTGFYLFNPFAENMSPSADHLDDTVELSEARYWRDVRAVEEVLARAPTRTRVVTYCGFGGKIPKSYVLVLRERRAGQLELWKKVD